MQKKNSHSQVEVPETIRRHVDHLLAEGEYEVLGAVGRDHDQHGHDRVEDAFHVVLAGLLAEDLVADGDDLGQVVLRALGAQLLGDLRAEALEVRAELLALCRREIVSII